MTTNNRPMSPHLDIYRWRITMLTSTLHRISGLLVSLGMFVLVVQLVIISTSGETEFQPSGFIIKAFWFFWSLAIYYHLCNGIRHLVWDAGMGFDVATAEKSAKMVLGGSLVLTLVTWIIL